MTTPNTVERNRCGTCTVCCTIMEVPEFQKSVYKPCKHCDNTGCMIYPTRPNSCRSFECLWFKDESLPESWRPDKCGVVIEQLLTSDTLAAYSDGTGRWNSEETLGQLQKLVVEQGRSVVLKADGALHFMPAHGESPEELYKDILKEFEYLERK